MFEKIINCITATRAFVMETLEYLTLIIVFLRCWGAKRISKFTGIEEGVINDALKRLLLRGYVVRDGLFKYRVTAEGYKVLENDIVKSMQEAFESRIAEKGFFVGVANLISEIIDAFVYGIELTARAVKKFLRKGTVHVKVAYEEELREATCLIRDGTDKNQKSEALWDEERCYRLLREHRWHDGRVRCPRCGSDRIKGPWRASWNPACYRYLCESCGRTFNDKTGTVFAASKIKLSKWLLAAQMVKTGASVSEIAEKLSCSTRVAERLVTSIKERQIRLERGRLLGFVELEMTPQGQRPCERIKVKSRWTKKEEPRPYTVALFGGGPHAAMVSA